MGNLLIIFFALLFWIAPYFAAKWTFEGQEEYFKENNKIFEDIIELDTFKSNKIKQLEKIIDLMAEDRSEISEPKVSKEAIIDFYYKQVEEENE